MWIEVRRVDVLHTMKEIRLSNGQLALVSDEDYADVSRYKWYPLKKPGTTYALRSKPVTVYMHTQILKTPAGLHVDHINGNGLDNRRENIRCVRPKDNSRRIRKRKPSRAGYKGVAVSKTKGRWEARICVDYKLRHIGTYDTPEQAARAYDQEATKHFGEFAMPNFEATAE